jgi:hypothetical protein
MNTTRVLQPPKPPAGPSVVYYHIPTSRFVPGTVGERPSAAGESCRRGARSLSRLGRYSGLKTKPRSPGEYEDDVPDIGGVHRDRCALAH